LCTATDKWGNASRNLLDGPLSTGSIERRPRAPAAEHDSSRAASAATQEGILDFSDAQIKVQHLPSDEGVVKLSNKGRYGVRALFDLAFHGDGTSSQIRDIAERQRIPARFLEQIFQDLRRANLVSSKRGPRGGYQLTRAAREISLGDILRALEGNAGAYAIDEAADPDDAPDVVVTESAFRDVAKRVAACFDEVSLEDLCMRAEELGVRRSTPGGYAYSI
jgi:Rrf2 family protein